MASRQNLLTEINNLHLVVTKEWLKQAYFRKEKNIEYSIINDELHDMEKALKSQISIQEELLNTTFPAAEEFNEFTPRFLSSQPFPGQEGSSSFSYVLKTIAALKGILQQSFENQRIILTKFQSIPEQTSQSQLAIKYEKEKEKLNRLTQKYNDLNLEFLNVQEMMEELEYERQQERPCESCGRLKDRLKELEEQLQTHPSSEIQKFKEMYEEIKAAHDEIAEELNNQPRENYLELENDRENFMKQVSYLQETQRQLEGINADLMKKLESESSEVIKLSGYIDEYEGEIRKKNNSLERAQSIIKKLNIECEKLAKDLEKVESENEMLKKDNRSMSKTKTGVDKKMGDIEIMKKTEERLREELSAVKNKLNLVIEQKDTQINQLNGILNQQSHEKRSLEQTLEELEIKLNEIDMINKKRVEEFAQACQKIEELEEILQKKDDHIAKIKDDVEIITANKDQEFHHLKRQAENMIRHLNTLQSAPRLIKTERKPNESNKISLTEQLEDSLLRENQLKSLINDLISTEAQNLKNSLSNLGKLSAVSRAETERWVMRNEELEQRLIDLAQKNLKLNGFIKDLQKMIHFKNSQFSDYSKNSENLIKEQQAKIDFLTLELNSNYNQISRDLLPLSQKLITSSLGLSHSKLHDQRQQISQIQSQLALSEEAVCKLNRVIKMIEDEKDSISKLLYRSNSSIIYIDKHLGEVMPLQSSATDTAGDRERLSIIPESENINSEITEQARNIINKLIVMKDNEKRYIDRANQYEFDMMQTKKNLKEKVDHGKILENSYEKMQEENRYLTEIAYKEKEEKIKLKSILNDYSANEEKIQALTDYVSQVNEEKAQVEENCYMLRSELDKTQSILAVKSQQLEDIKENNFREISNLRYELDSVVQESKILNPCSQIMELQTIVDEQDKSLKTLQEKLNFAENKLMDKTNPFPPEKDLSQGSFRITELEDRIKALCGENNELKSTLNRRENSRSPAKYASHLEKLISQKNEMIADLEKELAVCKEKSFGYSQTNKVHDELEKLKKKKESDKKNFQKRVKEFELVLRYIEDKINTLLNSVQDPKSDKMQVFIDDLAKKNPNLMSWLKILVNNLESLAQR